LRIVLVISFIFYGLSVLGQENVTTVGFQIKPMIPNKFISPGDLESSRDWISAEYEADGGLSMGMVIRKGLTKSISLETGISYVRRDYGISVLDTDSLFQADMSYSFINYQLPIQGLIYTRLTDKLWMNASGGVGVNFYPSNAQNVTLDYRQTTFRTGKIDWIKFSLLANYGFEYRTKDSGFFYLGISLDRPFTDIAVARATIRRSNGEERFTDGIYSGSYVTIDLRYFFHEDPERKRRVKKRKN